MSFYKNNDNKLLIADNFVHGPGFDLFAETHTNNTYPIDGWYWFDTLSEAETALGIKYVVPAPPANKR